MDAIPEPLLNYLSNPSLTGFWAAYHYWTSVRSYAVDDLRVRTFGMDAAPKPAET